jgi:hypothetical protein
MIWIIEPSAATFCMAVLMLDDIYKHTRVRTGGLCSRPIIGKVIQSAIECILLLINHWTKTGEKYDWTQINGDASLGWIRWSHDHMTKKHIILSTICTFKCKLIRHLDLANKIAWVYEFHESIITNCCCDTNHPVGSRSLIIKEWVQPDQIYTLNH